MAIQECSVNVCVRERRHACEWKVVMVMVRVSVEERQHVSHDMRNKKETEVAITKTNGGQTEGYKAEGSSK